MSSTSTLINNDRLVTATKSEFVQATLEFRFPRAAAPGLSVGSACMNIAGTQLLIRAPNGNVGAVNVVIPP
jgi:hypothetical protein